MPQSPCRGVWGIHVALAGGAVDNKEQEINCEAAEMNPRQNGVVLWGAGLAVGLAMMRGTAVRCRLLKTVHQLDTDDEQASVVKYAFLLLVRTSSSNRSNESFTKNCPCRCRRSSDPKRMNVLRERAACRTQDQNFVSGSLSVLHQPTPLWYVARPREKNGNTN